MPRGMIEILWPASVPGSADATTACPISWCATISRSRGLRSRFFFSSPATIRSTATLKSSMRISSAPRLVHEVGQVGAAEAGGERRHLVELQRWRELHLARVDLQDGFAAAPVGPVDQHLPVEAAGTQQRGVEDLRPARRAQQDDPDRGVETVELGQELVQRLLLLVVAASETRERGAGAAERVQLVDEDDGRRLRAGLLEQIAHARRTHANEHLDELGAGNEEERHAGLAGHGLGEQRL